MDGSIGHSCYETCLRRTFLSCQTNGQTSALLHQITAMNAAKILNTLISSDVRTFSNLRSPVIITMPSPIVEVPWFCPQNEEGLEK